jgi:nucleoside-diphosphate-sugar epimerase
MPQLRFTASAAAVIFGTAAVFQRSIGRHILAIALVAGATGKTGRLVVEQLLSRNYDVRVVVRSSRNLPAAVLNNPKTTVIEASILNLTDEAMADAVKGCDAVVSCLGHVMNFKGMFGEPRKLCTDAIRRLGDAIEANQPANPARLILMSSVGIANPELNERRTATDRLALTLLHYMLPPHSDNETAAEHLHRLGSKRPYFEWCCVRPDSLIDAEVSPYKIVASPSTGIFSGRPTSRSNVAHFMAELIEHPELWAAWKFRMPVIMNAQTSAS